ncbi:hypothetical protein TREES_T100010073 [Tupaia chinensis]|uniref:Uncharacterized protein n=1 Tax=Tupaia chinensis TaxID=246437 RepID=L9KEH9_TUPCH|nr:hypothetical protein TREES_T100010073 [Tupaia chinensis]
MQDNCGKYIPASCSKGILTAANASDRLGYLQVLEPHSTGHSVTGKLPNRKELASAGEGQRPHRLPRRAVLPVSVLCVHALGRISFSPWSVGMTIGARQNPKCT